MRGTLCDADGAISQRSPDPCGADAMIACPLPRTRILLGHFFGIFEVTLVIGPTRVRERAGHDAFGVHIKMLLLLPTLYLVVIFRGFDTKMSVQDVK